MNENKLEEMIRLAENVRESTQMMYDTLLRTIDKTDEPESTPIVLHSFPGYLLWLARFESGRYTMYFIDNEGLLYYQFLNTRTKRWEVTRLPRENR